MFCCCNDSLQSLLPNHHHGVYSHLLIHITCSTSFRLFCVPGHYLMCQKLEIDLDKKLSVLVKFNRENLISRRWAILKGKRNTCVEMAHSEGEDASSGCRGRAQLTWQYAEGVFSGRSFLWKELASKSQINMSKQGPVPAGNPYSIVGCGIRQL